MISLARFAPWKGYNPLPLDPDGKYVLFVDVEELVEKMERRHKLAMDKLRASFASGFNTVGFNTGGTISGRPIPRGELNTVGGRPIPRGKSPGFIS